MKKNLGWVFSVFFSVNAFAITTNELPAKYLTRLQGLALEGLATYREVTLSPGSPQSCKKTTVGNDWAIYKCAIGNGYALITRQGGLPINVRFTDTLVTNTSFKESSNSEETILRKYLYRGDYSEVVKGVTLSSRIELEFHEYDNDPGDIKGWARFVDYNYQLPLQMAYTQMR